MSLPQVVYREIDYDTESLKNYDCYTREKILGGRDQLGDWYIETNRIDREDRRFLKEGNTVIHRMSLPGGCVLFKLMSPRLMNKW
jgi:hypothetical protein